MLALVVGPNQQGFQDTNQLRSLRITDTDTAACGGSSLTSLVTSHQQQLQHNIVLNYNSYLNVSFKVSPIGIMTPRSMLSTLVVGGSQAPLSWFKSSGRGILSI